MATPALIDLSNYATLLVQSTVGRAGTPDGNIFFDTVNKRIELITAEEQALIDMTAVGGAASEANPLTEDLGIKLEALYAFENQERGSDEALRKFDRYFKGTFKFGGAYELVNANKFDDADGGATSQTTDDRFKIRGSGWIERNVAGAIGRIYYGVKSLGNIEGASLPYYQLAAGVAGTPVAFDKDGPIDEAIQVFGDIAIDTDSTDFDTRTYLSNKIRTFGYNYDEKILSDSGVTEMGGYASGFAIGESPHLTSATYTLADVYGGAQASPWTGMGLEELDVAQTETGFTTADGDFTWVINNTIPGNLDQVVAFLDALAQAPDGDDINDHATNTLVGQRVGVWYDYSADGKIQPKVGTGAASEGLFIEGLVGTDKNRVIFTDDAGAEKIYPSYSNVSVAVGQGAVDDTNGWFHAFFLDGPAAADYNTAAALTVEDSQAAAVKGVTDGSTGHSSGTNVVFEFDWYLDTIGGPIETNKDCVFLCEGDGGVTQAKTVFTLTNAAAISASCTPLVENNV